MITFKLPQSNVRRRSNSQCLDEPLLINCLTLHTSHIFDYGCPLFALLRTVYIIVLIHDALKHCLESFVLI